MKLLPDQRPQLEDDVVRGTIERLIRADAACHAEILLSACPVRLLGVRGYFRNTLGKKGVNDLGLYDDAIFLASPIGVGRFNANCDPVRAGWNKGVHKLFAQLTPGVWPFRQGPHRNTPGRLRQLTDEDAARAGLHRYFSDDRMNGEFAVERIVRDGDGEREWGYQAINVHPGSASGTSSWGCQTVPPAQWDEFRAALYDAMNRHGQSWERGGVIPYVLTEERLA